MLEILIVVVIIALFAVGAFYRNGAKQQTVIQAGSSAIKQAQQEQQQAQVQVSQEAHLLNQANGTGTAVTGE